MGVGGSWKEDGPGVLVRRSTALGTTKRMVPSLWVRFHRPWRYGLSCGETMGEGSGGRRKAPHKMGANMQKK